MVQKALFMNRFRESCPNISEYLVYVFHMCCVFLQTRMVSNINEIQLKNQKIDIDVLLSHRHVAVKVF